MVIARRTRPALFPSKRCFANLLAKYANVANRIIQAAQTAVRQSRESGLANRGRHGCPAAYERIEDFVEFVSVRGERRPFRERGIPSNGIIGMLL